MIPQGASVVIPQGDRDRVRRLLEACFDELERLWDRDPLNVALVTALVVKEFMVDRGIPPAEVERGLAAYAAFKREQRRKLAALGLR
jgi:hypothetical protein